MELGGKGAVIGLDFADAAALHVEGQVFFQPALSVLQGFLFILHGFDMLVEQADLGFLVQPIGGYRLGFNFKLSDNGFECVGGFGFVVEVGIENGADVIGALVKGYLHGVLQRKSPACKQGCASVI